MASFPTITDLRGLPDPQLQYRYTLIIPNVPGGGDGRRLQLQCISSSIPGLSQEKQTVTSHGIDLRFMGRQIYYGTIPLTFFETRDLVVMKDVRGWLDYGRNHRKGTGNYKENYAVTAQLLLLDDTLKVTNTITLEGFFPESLDDSGVDGSSSGVVQWSTTFSYDVSEIS